MARFGAAERGTVSGAETVTELWVTRALLLSGTFACAVVVFAYRDYALQQGWTVGRWAFSDTSWIKVLAAVSMIGAPLLGLRDGPWWLVFIVPVGGFFAALMATNLLRNLIQPIAILGLAVGWFFSLVWLPWLPSDPQHNWAVEEIQNAQLLFASYEANMQAIRVSNNGNPGFFSAEESAEWLLLNRTALEHAQKVHDSVLAKAHPELPLHFRAEYQRSLELILEADRSGDSAKSIKAGMLHDRWVDWWNANKADIRIPRR